MPPQELESRLGNVAKQRAASPTLVLSLAALVGSATIWLILLGSYVQAKAAAWQELPDFGRAFLLMALVVLLTILSSVGSLLALIGLAYEILARRHFHRLLALSLLLNAFAGLIPLLCVWVWNQYRLNPPLLRAVKSGSLQRVQSILSSYETAPEPDPGGGSALGAAVAASRMDMINALVSAYTRWHRNLGGSVTYEEALILACQRNDIDLARQLLVLQRHVARKPQHLGMIAAPAAQRMVEERRHGAVVLEAGADPNVYHGYGRLAANIAVRNGNPRLLQLLLDAGAKPIIGYPEPDPLTEAVAKGNAECVKLLLSYDTDKVMKREPQYGSYLLGKVPPGSESVRRILLDAGADPRVGPPDMTRARGFK